jgi:cytoskeletal protein RodZ
MPKIEPRMVPRAIAPEESTRSCRVGIKPEILALTISRLSADISRLRMISAKPNRPIATLVKPIPSDNSAISNVMRPAPVSRSEPTIDSSRPVNTMATDLSTEPRASTTAKIRPSSISEKYSAGPNSSARLVKGAPSAATSTVEIQPAKNEPIAEIDNAAPARPCRAI